jgi:putative glutamine amidotransferase
MKGGRPLIGVSTSEVRNAVRSHPSDQSEPQRRELALGMAYLNAVDAAGGIPVILAPLCQAGTEALLDRLDGLCLSGGPDITPSNYRAEPHPALGPTEPDLDRFELDLTRRARMRGLPVLGICRGAQLLNVSRGGTLFQHLPDIVGDTVEHRQPEVSDALTHTVCVRSGSRVADIVGTGPLRVNSFHHQAVDALGDGLRAVAWAEDGLVEGIEATDRDWVVGVQWHAEGLVDAIDQHRLFDAFLAAADPERARRRAA